MLKNLPLITVITITFNLLKADRRERFLQCVESVKKQSYKNIEHIIIDGASTDGTLELIQSTGLQYFSEPDSGVYDAMNKGIVKANGEYIVFLNSDDFWHGNKLKENIEFIEKNKLDYCYSDVLMETEDKQLLTWTANIELMPYAVHYCHQSLIAKTSIVKEMGSFDLSYPVSSDSDMMIKLYKNYKGEKSPHVFVTYRLGGFSANNELQSRKDHSNAFYRAFGADYNLTEEDCYNLWQWKYMEDCTSDEIALLTEKISKIPSWFEFFYCKKRRILYDAHWHQHYYAKNASRSGLFIVDMNILRQLAKFPYLEICLYMDEYVKPTLEPVLQRLLSEKAENYPNVTIYNGKEKEFDLYFSPFEQISERIRESGIACYTISYDLIPILLSDLHNHNFEDSQFNRLVRSWTFEDYFFTISDHTKSDLIKHLPKLDPSKITTTLLAASENFYQDTNLEKNTEIRKKYNIPLDKKYVFSLCTLEPRKNLIFSVKNFIKFIEKNNLDDLVFVLGGGHWDVFMQTLEKELENLEEFKSKIIKTGYIDDEDLASLYSHAVCTVYTSVYEGFGLPPLEAMQCGCPVITSNTSSLPEVVGDAGIMVAPTDDAALINAYETLYFDETLRAGLVQKSTERAKLFTWEKCAQIMVDTILKNPYTPIKISAPHLVNSNAVFHSSVVTLEHPNSSDSYKIKHYLFGIPVLRIAKQNDTKRVSFLGIPILKTRKSEKFTRRFLFGFLQVYKRKRKVNTNSPNNLKCQYYRFLSHITCGKMKKKFKEKYCFYKNLERLTFENQVKSIILPHQNLLEKHTTQLEQHATNIEQHTSHIEQQTSQIEQQAAYTNYFNENLNQIKPLSLSTDNGGVIYKAKIFSDSYIGKGTYVADGASISLSTIGKYCSIGPNLICGWGVHPLDGITTSPAFYSTLKQNGMTFSEINKVVERKAITIGNDVFIGANVTILDGVTVGDGAVIGAGAIVAKDVPPYAVVGGVPATVIKFRFSEDVIQKLLNIQWWNWKDEKLQEVEKMFFDVECFANTYTSIDTSSFIEQKRVSTTKSNLSEEDSILSNNKKLHNVAKNTRCFLLATGPSIKEQDLTLLAEEDCFSISNFFLHEDIAVLKPKLHFFAPYHQPLILENFIEWLQLADEKLPECTDIVLGIADVDLVKTYKLFPNRKIYYLSLNQTWEINTDITKPIMSPQTGPIMMLPVLDYMGYNEINLIGQDMSRLADYQGTTSNFYDHDPRKNATDGSGWADIITELDRTKVMFEQFQLYNNFFQLKGKKMYNLSPSSWVNFIEKKDFIKAVGEK